LVAILKRGGHVRVVYGELLIVEGVEDTLVVVEDLGSLRDAPIFVDDEAISTINSLGGWS
jgi:hypothetical protein